MSEEKTSGEQTEASPSSSPTPSPTGQSTSVDNSKLCAILSYLAIGIIWYFVDEELKKNEFVKYHVKQALVLLIVSFGGSFILTMIPILGWAVLPFFSLATVVLAVIGIVNAVNNEKKELPIIGTYASKFKF